MKELTSDFCVTNKDNKKLTHSQKEVLQYYFRLGHIGFQHVQSLFRTGRLKLQENSKAMDDGERPKCAACEFVKCHCLPNKVNTVKKNIVKEQELKKDHLLPEQMMSADHCISQAPGRIYHTKCKSDQSDMLSGGCVFIDHASCYEIIKKQVAINTTETFKAKITFEREAQSQGVLIKGYHTDNGIINAPEIMENLLKKQQKIRFIRAGASHQNGAS